MNFASLSPRARAVRVATVTALFLVLGAAGAAHHELWLDEAHHWLLARDSRSLSEMAYSARYEGHPLLWNCLLFWLSRFAHSPLSMQALHVCIATAATGLFLRFSPFNWVTRVAIVFGYFLSYEYSVICRNYALAWLLLVICCILFPRRRRCFCQFCVCLALLANTHLFGAFIAAGLFALSVAEESNRPSRIAVLTGSVLLGMALAVAFAHSYPPRDHYLYTYDFGPSEPIRRFGSAASMAWRGLVHVPDFRNEHGWNTNFFLAITKIISKRASAVLGLVAWAIPAILLIRHKAILLFFYVIACALGSFAYFSPLILSVRHCGFIWILLMASLWLAKSKSESESGSQSPESGRESWLIRRCERTAAILLPGLIIIQLFSAAAAYAADWRRPFSQGRAASKWIEERGLTQSVMVVSDHTAGPPLCAYLQRKVWYPENGAEGSFCRWNTRPFLISHRTVIARVRELLSRASSRPILLLTNRPLEEVLIEETRQHERVRIRPLAAFTGSIVAAEDYYIYEVRFQTTDENAIDRDIVNE